MQEALENKRQYIKWFLDSQKLKEPGAVEILRIIMEEDFILQKVNFVDSVRGIPTALLISADSAATVSYVCRINGVYYEDIAEIIAILINDPPQKLYLWLSYDRECVCSQCHDEAVGLNVRPIKVDGGYDGDLIADLEWELNQLFIEKIEKRARLLMEIDRALDNGDKEQFIYLSALYKELQ